MTQSRATPGQENMAASAIGIITLEDPIRVICRRLLGREECADFDRYKMYPGAGCMDTDCHGNYHTCQLSYRELIGNYDQ